MYTYNDLVDVGQSENARATFIYDCISEFKGSGIYRIAKDGQAYAEKKNTTIEKYQKLLYTITGKAVPDNYTANHKCKSSFFDRFTKQQASFLLGNGVFFEDESTKEKLGQDFDSKIYKLGKASLIQGVAFGFWNFDKLEIFQLYEKTGGFVPLYDEENGALKAGIRFWQVADDKPLRATLYEIDGVTEWIKKEDENLRLMRDKQAYIDVTRSTEADGILIYNGENYPSFPIVPLWGNLYHQSELVGLRENIDCYDLIKSGFANDLDDASMIYWTLQNCGGMDDIDLAKFIERMKTVKAATVDGEDGARAEAHTIEVPYQSREVYLTRIENDLYNDYMALNTDTISAGNVTATAINAAYEPLNNKADEWEYCLIDFITEILRIAGIEDYPKFRRSRIVNQNEETQMVLSVADYIDEETLLKKIPWLTPEEVSEILEKKEAEEQNRFVDLEKEVEQLRAEQAEEEEAEAEEEAEEEAEKG